MIDADDRRALVQLAVMFVGSVAVALSTAVVLAVSYWLFVEVSGV